MDDTKTLSNLTLEELGAKQKYLANLQKIFVSIAVVLVGMTLFAVYTKSYNVHPFFILGSLFLILNNGTKLKKAEVEINKRKV